VFCPSCGAEGQSADSYCKRCGDWLPERVGFIRRALWGQGTTPEQKIGTMLIRDAVTAALALSSAIALYLSSADGGASLIVKIIIGVSLLIAVAQIDSFMVGFRLRQTLKQIRSDATLATRSPAELESSAHFNTAQLDSAKTAREDTTKPLERRPRARPRVK
jgi:hypothetical protein